MSVAVTDTHALLWYLLDPTALSVAAAAAFSDAAARGEPVVVPAISLVEVTYLVERGRVPAAASRLIRDSLASRLSVFELAPLGLTVIDALAKIPREQVPDMPDRIIAATALALDL